MGELSHAFAAVGRTEAADGGGTYVVDAYRHALEHAEAARDCATAESEADASWRGAIAQATAAALCGLRRFGEAKSVLEEALSFATTAMISKCDGATEQLLCDIVESIHTSHEQTDDRRGLEGFVRGLQALLHALRQPAGEEPASAIPIIPATEKVPDNHGVNLEPRARLLERIVLICIATGRERDAAVAKRVFMEFRLARESPNTRRLLGMLQSAGNFLDL